MLRKVVLGERAVRSLKKVPTHIAVKLKSWVELVEINGLEAARKIPGYHDEPLKGPRAGLRSIRLSRSYRAVYTVSVSAGGEAAAVVQEVSKHEY